MGDEIEVRDIREPGWMWAQHELLELAPAIRPSGVATYMVLCRRANNRQQAWPSAATIAEQLGIERKTVLEALQRIESVGLVRVERHAGCKSIYHLLDLAPVLKAYRSENRTGTANGPDQSEKRTSPSPKNGPEEDTGKKNHGDPLPGDTLFPAEQHPTSGVGSVASGSSPTPPKPPSPPRRRLRPVGDPRVRPVLAHFSVRYREKTGADFVPTFKRDGGIIRELPESLTAEALCDLVDRYFATADAYVRDHGYDVPTFRARLNALQAKGRPKGSTQPTESLSERLAREDEARMRRGATA